MPVCERGEGPNKRASAHFGNQSISVYILVTSQLIGFLLPSLPLLYSPFTRLRHILLPSPAAAVVHPNTCKNLTHTFTFNIDSSTRPLQWLFISCHFLPSVCLQKYFLSNSLRFFTPYHCNTLINLFTFGQSCLSSYFSTFSCIAEC